MTRRFGFIMMPEFALMSATSAIEPLRAANLRSGEILYENVFMSPDGGEVWSSAGIPFPTIAYGDAPKFDTVFVIAGANPFRLDLSKTESFIRKSQTSGCRLGGISGGAVVLAKAGVMANRRYTAHWEHMEALREEFPDHMIEKRLYVLDRDRATCAGGVAPLDMMHALIASEHGAGLAQEVNDWFIHTRLRASEDPQKRIEQVHHHPSVRTALNLMEQHIADPVSLQYCADVSGISVRQLQRNFQADVGQTPGSYYLALRLDKARDLLRQTRLPVSEIAYAAGFSSQSNFARAFTKNFGVQPSQTRKEALF